MTKEKVKTPPSIKINVGFIALEIITTYTTVVSVADIWINIFSKNIYTMFNYVRSIPVVALYLFVPLILKYVSVNKIFYTNAVAQFVSCVMFMFIPAMKVKLGRDAALAITILFLLISAVGSTVCSTATFAFAAEFSNQTVQFYITGLSVSNLFYGVYFLPFPNIVKNLQIRMICYFILPLVVHIASIIIFYFSSKKVPKKEERVEILNFRKES
ncbi:hypothetical protein MHBO_003430 [Bonamia ostreae]|uniref:Uncharacterized protein n=1 Tax=Bonamia ostreae TaxID=126728 RepID=A0ABV2AQZ6_9EUKA